MAQPGPHGYSGTPLGKKLGLKAGLSACVVDPPQGYLERVQPEASLVTWQPRWDGSTDWIHLFVREKRKLQAFLDTLTKGIHPECVVWVSWPKKASKHLTDITEDTIRELALPLGLVDIKVCAVDEVWSGLKLVWRKDLRPKRKPKQPV